MSSKRAAGSPKEITGDSPIEQLNQPEETYAGVTPVSAEEVTRTEDDFSRLLAMPEGAPIDDGMEPMHLPGHMQKGEYLQGEGKRVQKLADGMPPPNISLFKPGTRIEDRELAMFLRILAETGDVTIAARAIGRTKVGLYLVRKRNARFKELWDEAVKVGIIALEDEARRRAMGGSDILLMFKLKALDAKYKDRAGFGSNLPASGKITFEWGGGRDVPLERVAAEDETKLLEGSAVKEARDMFTVDVTPTDVEGE